MSLTESLLLVKLMVEHVSNRIQFGFMISFTGALFVVCAMVNLICSDCDFTCVLHVEDVQFPA